MRQSQLFNRVRQAARKGDMAQKSHVDHCMLSLSCAPHAKDTSA